MNSSKTLFGLVFLLISFQLLAQEVPILTSKDLLQKSDLKKKSGWMRISLSSDFQSTEEGNNIKYEYYEFVNEKGQYNSTYTAGLPFPKNAANITYSGKDLLLNGMVNFYDKDKNLTLQYLFKNGFYVKACEWKKPGSAPSILVEYIPKKNSVELFANYFGSNGNIESYSHEENDGSSYKTLPNQKDIPPISN